MFNRQKYLSVVILLSLVLGSGHVMAREKDGTTATGAIDAATFDVLMEAQELTQNEQFDQALLTLDKIKNSDKLNSYAKSQMWNFYAYIYASQEKYQDAINAYRNIVAEPDAPAGLKLTAKYTMAQLYFQTEDYTSVIKLMEEWLKEVPKPTATAHIILAQCYYQTKSHDAAIRNLDSAIALEQAEGKKINENWLRLKAAVHFDNNDPENTLNTYKQLLDLYPKTIYLRQIAGLYGEVGNELKRLTTYDALYESGKLESESEVLNLAYMFLGQDVPYKAGKIIETGMNKKMIEANPKNMETLANAWAQANEHKKAIPALEEAASIAEKGLLYARLAGVYFDAGDFEKAVEAAKKADEKGGMKNPDNNLMLLGMANFNIKKYEDALQSFRRAKGFKDSFNDARKWEAYTLSELERLRQLEQSKFELAEKTKQTLESDESNVDALGKSMLQNINEIKDDTERNLEQ